MAVNKRWYFSAEQLQNSPSRKSGIDANKELQYRQQTAYLIQEMGQLLRVSQLCINTAIVYMHRFYAFHSFSNFHRNGIAAASLFLAAKVEEQPRKLEHVIKVANLSLQESEVSKELFTEQAQDLVFNENVLLQTLGFDVAIDHPHTHVVKTCHLVKAGKDLAQTSYFMASNSLHLTTMCLQYKPTVVACFCIHLACKWSRWEIPNSTEGLPWFHYVDKSVTTDLLNELTEEFIQIYEKSPSRLKNKLNSIKALVQSAKTDEPPQKTSSMQPTPPAESSSTTSRSYQRTLSSGSGSNPSTTAAAAAGSSGHHHHSHHHHHHSKSSSSSSVSHPSSSSSQQPFSGNSNNNKSSKQFFLPPTAASGSTASAAGSGGSSDRNRAESRNNPSNMATNSTSHRMQQSSTTSSASGGGGQSRGATAEAHKSRSSSSSSMAPPTHHQPKSSKNYQMLFGEPNKTHSPGGLSGRHSSSSTSGNNSALKTGNPPDLTKGNSSNSSDTFQFLMDADNLRGVHDSSSMDGIQTPPSSSLSLSTSSSKPSKMQSIFSPEWKGDYMSGNTNHAKMNLPPGGPQGNRPVGYVADQKNPTTAAALATNPTTPTKKDRRLNADGSKQQSQEKKASSNSLTTSSNPKPLKRPYEDMSNSNPNKEEVDYREAKLRRSELENEARAAASDKQGGGRMLFSGGQQSTGKSYGELQPSKLGSSSNNNPLNKPNLEKFSMFSNTAQLETNPDLVSSLLKESLNADQTKPFTTIPVSSNPTNPSSNLHRDSGTSILGKHDEQLQPRNSSFVSLNSLSGGVQSLDHQPLIPGHPNSLISTLLSDNGVKESDHHPTIGLGNDPSGGLMNQADQHGHHQHGHKSDKKKKKDKHKHKEKDKSKEERKKHKKDKERTKEHGGGGSTGVVVATSGPPPMKIMLNNDREGNDPQPGIGKLKIKISKEQPSPQASLKIKIPKNLIDSNHNTGNHPGGYNSYEPTAADSAFNLGGGGSTVSGHKKKDKLKRDY